MKYSKQKYKYTCGPACMSMVLSSFGIERSMRWLMLKLRTSKRDGTKRSTLTEICDRFKLNYDVRLHSTLRSVKKFVDEGCRVIVAYTPPGDKFYHYAVVRRVAHNGLFLHDPWYGPNYFWPKHKFLKMWHDNKNYRWFIAMKKHKCR